MKVLFQIRSGYTDGAAGDSIQLNRTMSSLKDIGIDVSVSADQNINLNRYDLVHIFNCTRIAESYGFYKNAVRQKKKIAISPIFIDMNFYYRNSPAKLAAWRTENILRREMLQGSNIILPNSVKELEWIRNILFINTPWKIVYHGVDKVFHDAVPDWFYSRYGLKNFILCVGRLSPIKNQLSLIRAVKELSIPIVLIGPVNNKQYAAKCAEEADGCVKYIPFLGHQELASAYKAARVHVQPSYFETVGLASLEAAVAGTQVVITEFGGAAEYFSDKAFYINPLETSSIREGVLLALSSTEQESLKQHIKDSYTWEKTAKVTLEAYEQVLSNDVLYTKNEERFYSRAYDIPSIEH